MTATERKLATGWPFAVALVGITLVGPLSIHFYLPAAPVIQERFSASAAAAQLAFSIALFTMALTTLVYGSLSDRLGRRPVLLGGIALFAAGGFVCAFAADMDMLLAGRVVQGAGAGCSLVLARAIARDVYAADRLVKAIAYLTMAYILGPMLAPPIGGALVDAFGWRVIFVASAGAGLGIFVLVLAVLVETRRETAGIRIRLLGGYGRLARNLRFCGFAMQSAFGSGAFFAHASATTFLMKDLLQRPASEFGLYFMLFPSGFWLGTFMASRLGGKVPLETMVIAGSAVMVAAALALSSLMLAGLLAPVALFAPGFFLTFGQGLSLPSSQAGALTSVGQDLTGTASGVGAFMQMFCGGLLAQIVGLAADGTPFPMIVVVTVSATLALLAALLPAIYARAPTATPPSRPS